MLLFIKKKYKHMGRSTEYYRTHPEARKKKAKKDKEINARPEQKAKRRELGRKKLRNGQEEGQGLEERQGLFSYQERS